MQLQIITKNIELTEPILAYANEKVNRLSRYLPNISEAKLEISREDTRLPTQRFVAQITIDSKGTLIRAQERAGDIHSVIDNVTTAVAQRVKRFKGKLYHKGRGTSSVRHPEIAAEGEKAPPVKKVVKTKHFLVKPMSIEEAITQMELLGHDFFLFINADTEKLNLLYSRKDNNYGLIEAEIK
jgi:putative sigma-54 modulation protein